VPTCEVFAVLHRCCAAALSLTFAAVVLHIARGAAQAPAPATPPRSVTAAKRTNADEARRAKVLASFDGGQITVGDMEDSIANKSQLTRATIATGDGRKRFLEDMVRYDLLVREAERRGFATHATVVESMRQASITDLQARPEGSEPAVPAAAVAAYFSAHRERFQHGEQRRASYIELPDASSARAAIAELRGADRQRFAQFAREHSRDERTRRQGGELGYFERAGKPGEGASALPSQLVAAVFALDHIGEITPKAVALHDGFGVLMLTAKVPAANRTMAQVEGEIREQLTEQERLRQLDALVARLQDTIKPEVHAELLGAIALDPVVPLDMPHGFDAAPPDPRAPPKHVKPDGY
jgi:parvulin-like peptidyl-prolyl isomerase